MAESALGHIDQDLAAHFQEHLDQEAAPTETPEAKEDQSSSDSPNEPNVEAPSQEEEGVQEESEEEGGAEEVAQEEGAEAKEEGGEEAGDPEYIDTWDALAESLEFDPTELLNHLQIPGRADGETVSLADAVDQYRRGPDLDAAAQARIDSVSEELREDSKKRYGELEKLTSRMISKIERHRAPQGGWDELRARDPSEYIRLTELQSADRADAEAAISSLEEEAARNTEASKKADEKNEREQTELTYKLRPDWRDAKVGRAAFDEIQGYLQTSGFNQEQMDSLIDARSIITVWKAAQYDKSQRKKPRLLKRLRKLPTKHVKATARDEVAPTSAREKERGATLDRFRKSGKIKDAVSLFEEHL